MARELRASTLKKRTNAAAKRAANAARRMTAAKERKNMKNMMEMMERMGTNSIRQPSAMNMVRATQKRRRGGPLTLKKKGKGKKPVAPMAPFALAPPILILPEEKMPEENIAALVAGMGVLGLSANVNVNANAAKKAANAAKKAAAEAFAEAMYNLKEEEEDEEEEDEDKEEEEEEEESDSDDEM